MPNLNQQISLRLPQQLLKNLKRLAGNERRERSDLIRLYLEDRCEQELKLLKGAKKKLAPRRSERRGAGGTISSR